MKVLIYALISLSVGTAFAQSKCHYIVDCEMEFKRSQEYRELVKSGQRVILIQDYKTIDNVVGKSTYHMEEVLIEGSEGANTVTITLSGHVAASGYITENIIKKQVDIGSIEFKRQEEIERQRQAELRRKQEEELRVRMTAEQKAREERERRRLEEQAAFLKAEQERMAKEKSEAAKKLADDKANREAEKKAEQARIKAEKKVEQERIAEEKTKQEADKKAEQERIAAEKRANETNVITDPFGNNETTNLKNGLLGNVYEGQEGWSELEMYFAKGYRHPETVHFSQFNVIEAEFSEGFTNSNVQLRNKAGDPLVEWFAIEFTGYLTLPKNMPAGYYHIKSYSDDGIKLIIDNEVIINNPSIHSLTANCASKNLLFKPGEKKKVKLQYFQGPKLQVSLGLAYKKVDSKKLESSTCGLPSESYEYFEPEWFILPKTL